jgi:uncharacterized protein YqjF (DUF2071 family)
MVSFHVPRGLLERHVPGGLELDLIGGEPAASLVAFEFRDTRVFGVSWPGFRDFPEWNLRTYVRDTSAECREQSAEGPRRGVLFIREFVSSRIVSRLARRMYNEPYAAAPMRHASRMEGAGGVWCRYGVRFGHADHSLEATARTTMVTPRGGTIEHALKEQRWGFGRTRGGTTLCYEVLHPEWRVYEGAACAVEVDWARLYGAEWSVMQGTGPFSVMLMEGSAVTVAAATAV